jgi:hypothetical protein
MAENHHEIRHVDWQELLGFTHIFKSFKMAIHPSKLLLALVAIMLIGAGGWMLDRIWSVGKVYTAPDEIAKFAELEPDAYRASITSWEDNRVTLAKKLYTQWEKESRTLTVVKAQIINDRMLADEFRKLANQYSDNATSSDVTTDTENYSALLADAKEAFGETKDEGSKLLHQAYKNAYDTMEVGPKEDRKERRKKLKESLQTAEQGLTTLEARFDAEHDRIRGYSIFGSLLKFESNNVTQAMMSVRRGNFLGGMDLTDTTEPGFVFFVVRGFKGLAWLLCTHWVFGLILMLFGLAVWSVLGGAIFRIAAIHAARDEKISIPQAIKFSVEKFASFFMAPLMPLICIAVLGVAILLGALLMNIPWIGSLIYSLVFFVLALVGGGAIAFLLAGLVGGGPLMYPTIAVEGSDGFDAISRSYSYVFNRPWRSGLYAMVALVYGSFCYLFVHMFAFVTLKATHSAVKMGVWTGGEKMGGAVDKIDAMWSGPQLDSLHGGATFGAVNGMDSLAAMIMMVWIYLVIGMVVAFLISYVCSASTMIYYLLRRQVDATDLDDVYVLEAEEAELEAAAATPEAPAEEAPAEASDDA